MPCYTETHSYCHHGIEDVDKVICDVTSKIKEFDKTRKREEGEFQDLKKYADKVVKMLCSVMGEIDHQSPGIVLDEEVKQWWKKHKEFDKARGK